MDGRFRGTKPVPGLDNLPANVLLRALIMAVFWWIPQTGSCPTSCRCDVGRVTCSTLNGFPLGIPPDTKHLIISDSNISFIKRDDFASLSSLEVLDVTNNNIKRIQPEAFKDLFNLYYISIEDNQLTTIEAYTFVNLRLHRLHLSNNPQLTVIREDAFQNTTVENVHLQHCAISIEALEILVTAIGDGVRRLDISNNADKLIIKHSIFSGLYIGTLILRNNGIEDLSFLSTMTVDLLDVSDNPLAGNVWTIFTYVPGLSELVVEGAAIMYIPSTVYSASLIVLNLAHNNITHFSGGSLQGFPNLRTLILKDNLIKSLPRDISHYTSRLNVLDISENRIEILNPAAMNSLRLILFDASGNRITSLSRSLEELFNRIRNLNMEGNPFHCNCNMRWLSEWIRSLPISRRDLKFGRCQTPLESAENMIRAMKPAEFVCKHPLVLLVAGGGGNIGDTATIECKATGDPAPVLHLYMDSILLRIADSPAEKLQQEVKLTYHIDRLNCTDIGNYTCLGTSVAGMDEETLSLGSGFVDACAIGGLTTTGVPITSSTTAKPPASTTSESVIIETSTIVPDPTDNQTNAVSSTTQKATITITTPYDNTTTDQDISSGTTTPIYNVTQVSAITLPPTGNNITTVFPVDRTVVVGNDQGLPNATNAFIIPIVVCLAIILVFALCVTMVMCYKRASDKYRLRARHQKGQNVPTISHHNWAFVGATTSDLKATENGDKHVDDGDAKSYSNGQTLPSVDEITWTVDVHASDITCVSNGNTAASVASRGGITYDDMIT